MHGSAWYTFGGLAEWYGYRLLICKCRFDFGERVNFFPLLFAVGILCADRFLSCTERNSSLRGVDFGFCSYRSPIGRLGVQSRINVVGQVIWLLCIISFVSLVGNCIKTYSSWTCLLNFII